MSKDNRTEEAVEDVVHETPHDKRVRSVEHASVGVAAGAIAGAAAGSLAGVPGAVVGGIVGGVAGAIAAVSIDRGVAADAAREAKLDEECGVLDGEIGAPNLPHLPVRIGMFSAGSAGAGSARHNSEAPDEGPMSTPDK